MKTSYVFAVLLTLMLVLNLEVNVKHHSPRISSKAAYASQEAQDGDCWSCTDSGTGQAGVRISCRSGASTCTVVSCTSGTCG